MPRARKPENKGLPERWTWQHGAIYYQVPKGQEKQWDNKRFFRLGKTPFEAHKKWVERIDTKDEIKLIHELLNEYEKRIVPTKAPKTQKNNISALKRLRAVFGEMNIHDLEPVHCNKYYNKRGANRAAEMEIVVLSDAYTVIAVGEGHMKRHPFKGELRLKKKAGKEKRYVEDWEIIEALSLKPRGEKDWVTPFMSAYVNLKYLIGLRMTDMLRLLRRGMQENGIHVTPSKTQGSSGKRLIIKRTPAVEAAWNAALAACPVHISPLIFCNRRGLSYLNEETGEAYGFYSLWSRWMERVIAETEVTEPFSERDIRAKTGSDMESDDAAKDLLGHTNASTTRKHYRRKPQLVKPLK